MGIKNLSKLLTEELSESVNKVVLNRYVSTKIAIDLSSYLYQYRYNAANKGRGSHIRGFFEMIISLSKHGILPIFVKDGRPSQAKQATLDSRQAAKQSKLDKIRKLQEEILEIAIPEETESHLSVAPDGEIALDLNTLLATNERELSSEEILEINLKQQEISKHQKNIVTINGSMYRELQELFDLCGVPMLQAAEEADFLCAKLCKDGITSAVLSEDMDLLTHGATKLLRGINSTEFRKDGILTEYSLDKILAYSGLSMSEFIDTCILCGCDYADPPKGVGCKSAFRFIKKHRTIEEVIRTDKKYNYDSFTYQLARKEFDKSNKEKLTEITAAKARVTDSDRLVRFLTTKCNYTPGTALKKINEINSSHLKLASPVHLSRKPITVKSRKPKIVLKPRN